MILRRAVTVTFAGVVAGIPLAYAGTGLVRSLLFEVVPRDAVSLASACLLLLGVGLAGAVVPAKRAIDMNPVDTLRSE
jgi:putative ABC transport system permease protein